MEENQQRRYDNDASDASVDNSYSPYFELMPEFVDKVGESEPPSHRSYYYAQISHYLRYDIIGHDEDELSEKSDEKEDYGRIGESDEEPSDEVVNERTLVVGHRFERLRRIGPEGKDSEY